MIGAAQKKTEAIGSNKKMLPFRIIINITVMGMWSMITMHVPVWLLIKQVLLYITDSSILQ